MKKHIKTIICVLLVLVVGGAAGFFGGNLIVGKYFQHNVYANLTEEELVDDVNLINYKSKTPDQLSGTEVFVVGQHLFNTSNFSENYSSGTMETSIGITQLTTQYTCKNGDVYHNETLTYGSFLSNATMFDYTIGGNVFNYVGEAKSNKLEDVVWDKNSTEMTLEEFEAESHSQIESNWAYIISSKTVLSASQCTIDGELYSYTLELDPVKAPLHYAKQISYFMATTSMPTFVSISYSFTVDKNFNLVETHRTEHFKLNYAGVLVDVYGTINNILVTR